MRQHSNICMFALTGLLSVVGTTACKYYDTDRLEGSRLVTVSGCVQSVPGFNNFVLANVGAKQGAEPRERQTYRLEGDGNFDEMVGKQVQVRGELTATLDDSDSGETARKPGDQLEVDDLGVLRVQSLDRIDGTCGATFGN